MISQRRTAQVGLLAAVAVLVTSFGILISQGGDNSQTSAGQQAVSASSQHNQNAPMTLSAAADSDTTVVVHH
jgi:hypothetical protein